MFPSRDEDFAWFIGHRSGLQAEWELGIPHYLPGLGGHIDFETETGVGTTLYFDLPECRDTKSQP